MNKICILILAIAGLLTPNQLPAGQFVRGSVYQDLNGNRKKESHEAGIEKVPVSNGRQVVLTDSRGRYQIAVSEGQIIFVIKPSQYDFPLDAARRPLFYYIHKPQGSPRLKYGGSPATGDLPSSLDFGLIPAPTVEAFKILLFGDPQPYNRQQVDYFMKGIVSELLNVKGVAFGISLGDLVGDDLDLFQPYREAVEKIGIPWHHVLGNHDMNFDAKTDILSDETFERHFGPSTYAFNHGQVHFILLDDVLYPDPRDGKGYWGGFRKDQLAFVENDLRYVPEDYLVVIAVHIPFRDTPREDNMRDEDLQRLYQLLKDFPYTLSLSAHTHLQRQDFFDARDGWPQKQAHHQYNVGATCGDWYQGRLDQEGIPIATMRDGTPKGYAYVHFNRNQYVIDYKAAGHPPDYRIRIHAPKVIRKAQWSSATIVANFFIGSRRDQLFYRIDKGEWKKMHHLQTLDPLFTDQRLEWDFTDTLIKGRRPSLPEPCEHLWFGKLPSDLPEGKHSIEVKALDMFGRMFRQSGSYRIATEP